MAENADRELEMALDRARAQSKQWLQNWILQKQHLKGGTGLQLPGLGKIGVKDELLVGSAGGQAATDPTPGSGEEPEDVPGAPRQDGHAEG